MFLDEDNWFEPNHIPNMIDELENNKWDWCYSLRRIVDKDGTFIMNDDCDSLGIYPNYEDINFVDMNCYLFKTSVLMQIAHSMIDIENPHIGDKKLYKEASTKFPYFGCTKEYTVNYRLSRPDQYGYFTRGNKLTREKYQGDFPWKKK
jgi:hypothetical protein